MCRRTISLHDQFGYGDVVLRQYRVIAIQHDGIVAVPAESESTSQLDEQGYYAADSVFFTNKDINDFVM